MSSNGIFAGDDLAMMDDAASEIGYAAARSWPIVVPCGGCGRPVLHGVDGLVYDDVGRHTCEPVAL